MVNHEQSNRFPALAIFLLLSLLGHLWLMMLWTPLPSEPKMPASSSTSVSLSIRAGKSSPAVPEPVPTESLPVTEPAPAPPETPVTESPADPVEPTEPLTAENDPQPPQTSTETVVTATQSDVVISDADTEQTTESSPPTSPDSVAQAPMPAPETLASTVTEPLDPVESADTSSEATLPAAEGSNDAAPTSSEAEPTAPSDDLVFADGFSEPTVMPATLTPARFAGPTPRVITPPEALRRRLRGTVILGGFVDTDGALSQVRILESSGHELLDEAASEQAPQWQYEPARNGTIVSGQWVRIPVTFR